MIYYYFYYNLFYLFIF